MSAHVGGERARTGTGDATLLDAVRQALADALEDDPAVFLLGEDIGHFGGAFGVTKGLAERFGSHRVLDTPISEEGFVGAALGAAWMGERPVVELQFADFVSCAFDPLVTVAAKTHWRSGIRLPVVVRAPFGRRGPRRAVPLAVPGGVVRRRARAQGRHAGDGLRRLRAAARGDRGRRSRALLRAQGAVPPNPGRAAGQRASRAARRRLRRQGGSRRDGRHLRGRGRARAAGRGGVGRRDPRPAHRLAVRRRRQCSSPSAAPRGSSSCRRPRATAASALI